ncbi:hypothetical protein [Shewanella scandinavica]|uniref:hypothetical protein n=1 Tax=Shewanella scandinavica TaxID=3063538 RepID=UPI003195179B
MNNELYITNSFFLKFAFCFFILWDIYSIHLGKVFDLTGIILVTIYLLVNKSLRFERKHIDIYYSLVGFFLFGLILTLINMHLQEFLAISIGLFTMTMFYHASRKANFISIVEKCFYFIVFFQLVHFLYYAFFGANIVFYPTSLFNSPRNYAEDRDFFRATGFFAEANAIVSTILIFNIFTQSINYERKNIFLIISIFSNLIAKSIFGFLIIPFYLAMLSNVSFKLKLFMASVFLIVIIYNVDLSIFLYRFENFNEDQSFSVRLGLHSVADNIYNLLIPSGFDVIGSSDIGINGFYFLLNTFGVLTVFLLYLKYKILGRNGFVLYILLLATYQMYTTQLLWAFLGLILGVYNASKNKSNSTS